MFKIESEYYHRSINEDILMATDRSAEDSGDVEKNEADNGDDDFQHEKREHLDADDSSSTYNQPSVYSFDVTMGS